MTFSTFLLIGLLVIPGLILFIIVMKWIGSAGAAKNPGSGSKKFEWVKKPVIWILTPFTWILAPLRWLLSVAVFLLALWALWTLLLGPWLTPEYEAWKAEREFAARQATLPPPCKIVNRLLAKNENAPVGDWCFNVASGETFHFTASTTFEMVLTTIPEARVIVFDPYGEPISEATKDLKPGDCFRGPPRWGRMEVIPTGPGGQLQVRVGTFRHRLIEC